MTPEQRKRDDRERNDSGERPISRFEPSSKGWQHEEPLPTEPENESPVSLIIDTEPPSSTLLDERDTLPPVGEYRDTIPSPPPPEPSDPKSG